MTATAKDGNGITCRNRSKFEQIEQIAAEARSDLIAANLIEKIAAVANRRADHLLAPFKNSKQLTPFLH